uniref:Uncharacterized protein n=1 Tax=Arundo donax TaxID=35708 RepID=A0A0A8ZDD4_ARUDO
MVNHSLPIMMCICGSN